MVAGRFFLLVRGVVLLIDDDESQINDGSEYRRARAYHHARVAAFDLMPLLIMFAIGESRVQDGHFVTEDLMQVGGHRRS